MGGTRVVLAPSVSNRSRGCPLWGTPGDGSRGEDGAAHNAALRLTKAGLLPTNAALLPINAALLPINAALLPGDHPHSAIRIPHARFVADTPSPNLPLARTADPHASSAVPRACVNHLHDTIMA